MDRSWRNTVAGIVALVALLLLAAPVQADFDAAYCSSQNTASTDAANHEWQSNGWCTTQCNSQGTFAFAVILDQDCWCSNYVPEDQQDTGECNENCPGFPSEKCGNKDKSLYIYIKLDGSPSGTQGAPEPTSANSEQSSNAPTATTLQTTATTNSEESATSVPPQTSVTVVTESGRIITQTIITTPTSVPVLTGQSKSSSNTGAIVGGVVGGVAVLAASIGGILFFLWRRRKQQGPQDGDDFQSGVTRNTSTMSKAGLLRGEKQPQYPPPLATNFTRRSSRMLDNESISPVSGSDRRNSRPMIDQRLNPSLVFALDNSSRGSVASIDDSRDYHRTLNIRNPDPNPE